MYEKYLRDNVLTLFLAGNGPVSSGLIWFFWLVSTHPIVEAKIIQEIKDYWPTEEENHVVSNISYLSLFLCVFIIVTVWLCFSLFKKLRVNVINCVSWFAAIFWSYWRWTLHAIIIHHTCDVVSDLVKIVVWWGGGSSPVRGKVPAKHVRTLFHVALGFKTCNISSLSNDIIYHCIEAQRS